MTLPAGPYVPGVPPYPLQDRTWWTTRPWTIGRVTEPADTAVMESTGLPNNSFNLTSRVIARLTEDMSVAIRDAHDQDSRLYAFALVHVHQETSSVLASAIWRGTEAAGVDAIGYLARTARWAPATVPSWLRVLAAGWPH